MSLFPLAVRFAALTLVLCFISVPLLTFAATIAPSCSLIVLTSRGMAEIAKEGTVFIHSGDPVGVLWQSENATSAQDEEETFIPFIGIKVYRPTSTEKHSYTFGAGNKKVTCSFTSAVVTGNIDSSSLNSRSSQPTLSGIAEGINTLSIRVTDSATNKVVYSNGTIKVKNGQWQAKISKKLSDGSYAVLVTGGKGTYLTTGTLLIGANISSTQTAATTLVAGPIPLLSGGIVHAGSAVPISYLQIVNTGKENATVSGFRVKQDGSAPVESIIGLTTVDDMSSVRGSVGGVEGATPFKSGSAVAPIEATLVPGQMRLFTIKAVMSTNVSAYLGQQLKLNVTSIESNATVKGTFPILGTTWTIVP